MVEEEPKSFPLTSTCAALYASLCAHTHKNVMKIKSRSYLNAIFLDALIKIPSYPNLSLISHLIFRFLILKSLIGLFVFASL